MEQCTFVDGYFVAQDCVCACGKEHRIPIQEIIVKPGALRTVMTAAETLGWLEEIAEEVINDYQAR